MSTRLDPDPRRARVRLGVGAALVLVLVALGVTVVVAAVTPGGEQQVVAPGGSDAGVARGGESGRPGDSDSGGSGGSGESGESGGSTGSEPAGDGPASEGAEGADGAVPLYVHVLGQVAHPGLYVLGDGDRAVDAIAAAGGFSPTADRAGVNLARPVVDGEQLVVPELGASPPAAGAGGANSEEPGGASGSAGADGVIDLNRADSAALETLPRVGPALAERIIAWRDENGPFTAIEDLMAVSGIGEKTFEGLRDLVRV